MHGLRLRLVTAGNYSHGLEAISVCGELNRSLRTLVILVPIGLCEPVDLIWRLSYCQYPSVLRVISLLAKLRSWRWRQLGQDKQCYQRLM